MEDIRVSPKIIRQLIEPILVKSVRDKKFIADAIVNMIGSTNLPFFLDIINREDYRAVSKFCYVRLTPSKYVFDERDVDIDTMKELGLMDSQNRFFGQVINHDSFQSDFDPYYYKMCVNIYHHDENKKIITTQITVDTSTLEVIDYLPFKNVIEQTIEL
mgnify:CR=1 FL=1